MKATGLSDGDYEVRYYDADRVLIQIEINTSSAGELLSEILPSSHGSAAAGIWEAILYELPKIKEKGIDTFNVQESAIPEFPSVATGIGATVLCGVIFLWMRKRAK